MINIRHFILLAFILCLGCQLEDSKRLSKNEIKLIKANYSTEMINYFYEIAFFNEGKNSSYNQLNKWKKDPNIFIHGDISSKQKEDIHIVLNLINKQFQLPFKISITDDKEQANINIFAGDENYLKKYVSGVDTFNGSFEIFYSEKEIVSANIFVKNNLNYFKNTITEEIVQCLGLTGDSYSYPNSLFFQNENDSKSFTDIDIKILKLLYDPLLPQNYKRKDFEKDFEDVLYAVNSSQKIQDYIIQNKIPKETLKSIKKHFFYKGEFYKHPKSISVFIKGDYDLADSLQIIKTINALNKINRNINLKINKLEMNTIVDGGIFFNFIKVRTQNKSVIYKNTSIIGRNTMINMKTRNNITLRYINVKESSSIKKRFLVENLYQSLGAVNVVEFPNLYIESNDELFFGEEYKNMLNLVYQDEFTSGFTEKKFDKIVHNIFN